MAAKAKIKAKGKTAAKKSTAKKSGPVKKARKTIPSTEFSVHAPDAKDIFLAGNFNNWQSDSKNFRLRRFKDGTWKKMVKLKPGIYEYQFVVDGQWWTDPGHKKRVLNQYGTENSVKIVK
jgi:1,4-alpha-glucan branching enzyme